MHKLIWRVDPAPTGRYRSFQKRGWPSAHYDDKDERPAAMIQCEDDYDPQDVRAGTHKELTVYVADYRPFVGDIMIHEGNPKDRDGRFKWRKAKERAKTLDDAKRIAQSIIDNNPLITPKGE